MELESMANIIPPRPVSTAQRTYARVVIRWGADSRISCGFFVSTNRLQVASPDGEVQKDDGGDDNREKYKKRIGDAKHLGSIGGVPRLISRNWNRWLGRLGRA